HSLLTLTRSPRILVRTTSVVAVPVPAPLPYVSVNVIQIKSVLVETTDRGCERKVVAPVLRLELRDLAQKCLVGGVGVVFQVLFVPPEEPTSLRPGPTRVLPFRLRWQSIGLLLLLTQPPA